MAPRPKMVRFRLHDGSEVAVSEGGTLTVDLPFSFDGDLTGAGAVTYSIHVIAVVQDGDDVDRFTIAAFPTATTVYTLELTEVTPEQCVFVHPSGVELSIPRQAWVDAGRPVTLQVPIVGKLTAVDTRFEVW